MDQRINKWPVATLTVHVGCVDLERNEYVGRCDLVFLCDAEDGFVLQEGRIVRAKRRVGRNDNAGLLARSENIRCKACPNKPKESM